MTIAANSLATENSQPTKIDPPASPCHCKSHRPFPNKFLPKCIQTPPSLVLIIKDGQNEVIKMTEYGFFASIWWIFPLLMIVVCALFMRKGCGRMMCGPGDHKNHDGSALEILDKRFAAGNIDRDEYEERKRGLSK